MRRILMLTIAPLLLASDVQLDAPVLGFVARTQPLELRAVLGVPGAARFSEPLALPEGVTALQIAPRHGWVLAVREGGPALAWAVESGSAMALEEVRTPPDLAAFSPSGKEAAFYWREAARLVVYEGLPASPRVARQSSDLGWPGDLSALALADGGEWLGGCTASGRLLLMGAADLVPIDLYSAEKLTTPAFLARSTDLVVADPAGARVLLFERPAEQTSMRVVLSGADGLEGPDSVWAGEPGTVFVASRDSRRLWAVDLSTGAARSLEAPLDAPLQALRLPGLLLVSGSADQPAWLVHSAGATERLSFVPAPERPRAAVEE